MIIQPWSTRFSPLSFRNLEGNGCGDPIPFLKTWIPDEPWKSWRIKSPGVSGTCTPATNQPLAVFNSPIIFWWFRSNPAQMVVHDNYMLCFSLTLWGFQCIHQRLSLQGREQFHGSSPVAALGVGFERLSTLDQVEVVQARRSHSLMAPGPWLGPWEIFQWRSVHFLKNGHGKWTGHEKTTNFTKSQESGSLCSTNHAWCFCEWPNGTITHLKFKQTVDMMQLKKLHHSLLTI